MRIAILDDYQGVALDLADWGSLNAETTVFANPIPADGVAEALRGFDVVVAMRERTRFPATLLHELAADGLRLLVSTGRRNAAIDVAAAAAAGVTVCSTGYLPAPAAEHTWALILAASRRLRTELAAIPSGGWQSTVGHGLEGRTLGVLGLGNLGSRVARVGLAFGMDVIAWSTNLTPEIATERAPGVRVVSKDELFLTADILSVHLVLSARSRGIVGADELALMKPGSLLVNTSRGPIVDEPALLEALGSGSLTAALDVFDVEPLPAAHPLRTTPNTVLTPHLGYVTEEQYRVFFGDAVEDIAAFAAGAPIRVMT